MHSTTVAQRDLESTTPAGMFMRPRVRLLALSAVVVIYLAYCLAVATTRAPWYDEGINANPPYNWIRGGYPGISSLDETGSIHGVLPGISRHNYAEMPLQMALLAGWFKVFGFSLLSMRMSTILCGLVLLALWYFVVKRLTGDPAAAVVTFALTALDYGYILRSSEGRMDALSAAFGFGGLAVYLYFRERNFTRAVILSHAAVAASAFTHPNGGALAFAGLVFLTLYYDRRQIRGRHIALALTPYLAGAAAWGLYIARDVESFKAQFAANAEFGGRLNTFTAPWTTLKNEIVIRYLGALGGLDGTASGLKRLKLAIPIAYWIAAAGVLFTAALRRHKGVRALLLLTGIYFFVLAFSDGRKSQCYLVHVIPLYCALLALWVVHLWRQRAIFRPIVAVALLALYLIHAGGVAYQARQDTYHRSYLPAAHFLEQNVAPDQTLMASATFGFALGYPPNLVDDVHLGQRSGKTPEWIVVNDWYEQCFAGLRKQDPDAYAFVRARLANEYRPVYDREGVKIYRRR